jgi:hypothetical protein
MDKPASNVAKIVDLGLELALVCGGRIIFRTHSTESMWEYCAELKDGRGLIVLNLMEMCG